MNINVDDISPMICNDLMSFFFLINPCISRVFFFKRIMYFLNPSNNFLLKKRVRKQVSHAEAP